VPAPTADVSTSAVLDAVDQTTVAVALPEEAGQQLDFALLRLGQFNLRLIRPQVRFVGGGRGTRLALATRHYD
jgi:hypothetical protein